MHGDGSSRRQTTVFYYYDITLTLNIKNVCTLMLNRHGLYVHVPSDSTFHKGVCGGLPKDGVRLVRPGDTRIAERGLIFPRSVSGKVET